jgi:signal transduction histidine kinase/CheY-like chemotaxis protein
MTTAAGESAILPAQADFGPAPANPQDAVVASAEPQQRVIKIRRDYNTWVASETLEDYALRFAPRSARRWSIGRVANTAFGGAASFLVLEAVGATLLVRYGFTNAALAILATGLVIFLAGLPISVYAARHGVDMDLLTRGAGFGYIGSTITSLIYASFTFLFFALEAAVMAYALELAFDIPPAWGYLLCAVAVLPLVTHGVSMISRLQVWTQPLWATMLVAPYVFVFRENPDVLADLMQYGGAQGGSAVFDLRSFGAAMTVGIALITQMGEQADYLRFMPEQTRANRWRWWAGVVAGGPGWVVPGVLKMLGGALLACLAIRHMVPVDRAVDPNQMYLVAYEQVFAHYDWAVAATALFVVVSQLKINVTNAYAGSLAWSNFFSRVTHSHPGRVVWVVFNTGIALMLMELDVFQALGHVLGLYANIAISWMMAVVADLVINKPLGLSPKGIEFRRARLCDINPVGVGAMGIASAVSVAAHLGLFGDMAQAWSALIALVTALVASPLLAWWTGGRWYLAQRVGVPDDAAKREGQEGRYRRYATLQRCTICERDYEGEDMAHCPAYGGAICSLCCTLDARCHDLCKVPEARLSAQWSAVLRWVLPRMVWPYLDKGLAHYLLLMLVVAPLLGGLAVARRELALPTLALVAGVVAWWLVLAHKSRQVAQEEANRQTQALRREIESHRQTDLQLQQAKRQADAANQAKSRYITTISHELRTPLNSILGYAQLLEDDETMPPPRRQAVRVIRRGGDHLLTLIEGTLDIARIESGKLRLEVRPMRFAEAMDEIARLFELQAAAKGIGFRCEFSSLGDAAGVPACVRADEQRLRQILINIVGNAIKFTREGAVVLRLHHAREMARFEVIDSGPGMTPEELARIFEPFERGSATGGAVSGGAGLGLTISKMLTDLMGGELTVESTPGVGTTFRLRLFLPEVRGALVAQAVARRPRTGYAGPRQCVLVVDNEEVDRGLLVSLLQPLGFTIRQAASGEACLALMAALQDGTDPGPVPDALFMDLAMPGIDGWETLRRLRAAGQGRLPTAIVSANAFDKGLDNDVGIQPADFLVKPVRVGELLDWLGRRLALHWIEAPAPAAGAEPAAAAAPTTATATVPDAERLRALHEAVSIGHVRGVLRLLDLLDAERPECRDFSDRLRTLARQFQLDAMSGLLRQALDVSTHAAFGATPDEPIA